MTSLTTFSYANSGDVSTKTLKTELRTLAGFHHTESEVMAHGNVKIPEFSIIKGFLECPSCMQIYSSPFRLQCGHRFCEVCLYSMVRNKTKTCPIDGKGISPEKASVDTDLKEKLDSIVAECPLAKKGCKWNGKIKDMESHKRSCGYNTICCPRGCGSMIQKNALAFHAQTGCSTNLTRCPKCYAEMNAEQIKTHQCPCEKYNCPKGCGKKDMTLEELSAHTDVNSGDCDSAKLPCKFKDSGCEFVGTKAKLELHLRSKAEEHLQIVHKSLSKMRIEQRQSEEKVKEQSTQLKTIQESFYEYAVMLRKLDMKQEDMQKRLERQECIINEQTRQLSAKDAVINQLQAEVENCNEVISELRDGTHNGTLLWKIENFHEKLNKALSQKNFSIYSPVLYTSKFGYKLCAQLFPAGFGDNNSRYMSIYFHLMQTEHDDVLRWPFSHKISFTLLDQAENADEASNISYTIVPAANASNYQKPSQKISEGRGCHKFAALSELENRNYTKNDNLFIKIKVLQKS